MHVGARDGSAPGRRKVQGSAQSELDGVIVQRGEGAKDEERLLEVIAADLFELHRAIRVRAFDPIDELFVELGACSLEHPSIRCVADEDVLEPIRFQAGE
jgi:hypothetical protein